MLLSLGGMVVGAVIGIGVQEAVQSTGILGPGMDELIDDQVANFGRLEAKLDDLQAATDVEVGGEIAADLRVLLVAQGEFIERTHDELRGARHEIERLKQDALDASGAASGADLWLKAGESVSVGAHGNVFSLLHVRTNQTQVTVNGAKLWLELGESVDVPESDPHTRVFFKQGIARADGRVGYDVVSLAGSAP